MLVEVVQMNVNIGRSKWSNAQTAFYWRTTNECHSMTSCGRLCVQVCILTDLILFIDTGHLSHELLEHLLKFHSLLRIALRFVVNMPQQP